MKGANIISFIPVSNGYSSILVDLLNLLVKFKRMTSPNNVGFLNNYKMSYLYEDEFSPHHSLKKSRKMFIRLNNNSIGSIESIDSITNANITNTEDFETSLTHRRREYYMGYPIMNKDVKEIFRRALHKVRGFLL